MIRPLRLNGTVRMLGRWNYNNVREQMNTPIGAQRALLRLHSFQTEGEQSGRTTQQTNARGFNKEDAPALTKAAEFVRAEARRRNVDPFNVLVMNRDQVVYVQGRIMKYAAQLADWANRRDAAAAKAREAQQAQAGSRLTPAQRQVEELASRVAAQEEEWQPPTDEDIKDMLWKHDEAMQDVYASEDFYK